MARKKTAKRTAKPRRNAPRAKTAAGAVAADTATAPEDGFELTAKGRAAVDELVGTGKVMIVGGRRRVISQ